MRFNSYEFLLAFLPATWIGWRLSLRLAGTTAGALWLTLASFFFYAWWDWRFAPLLALSLLVNFGIGRRLADAREGWAGRRIWLGGGLLWNLGLLGYFKYWNFFLDNLNFLTGAGISWDKIVLPLGISFFTFQKIAFLVDAWRGRVRDVRFVEFALFVAFFPQLIAGPIVHHGEFIPQLRQRETFAFDRRRLALGLAVLAAGLFQKCVVADTLAPVADSAFGLAAQGARLRFFEAWVGVSAYSLQLFFDFSGYSHMALGLALLFGFRLPVNFLAPYTAASMIEFWRRWHITLSAFLRDYVYIPLGGNRNAHLRNLFLTMFLAGLWHGAGWTFVLWGVWHGTALIVNHLWRMRTGGGNASGADRAAAPDAAAPTPLWAHALTLLAVALGWVLFRAPDLTTARLLVESLFGWHGISVPVSWADWVQPLAPVVRPRGVLPTITASPTALVMLALAGWYACRGPRILAWLGFTADDATPASPWQAAQLAAPGTKPGAARAVAAGIMLALAVACLSRSSAFLYFQF